MNRTLTVAATAVLLALGAAGAQAAPMPAKGKVVKIVDGDTLKVRVAGATRTVELAGIDAPELNRCFGPQARNRLGSTTPVGAAVSFTFVGARPSTGSTRFKALVSFGGASVNRQLVLRGFAKAKGASSLAFGAKIISAQNTARAAANGLWKACEGLTTLRDEFTTLLTGKQLNFETGNSGELVQREIHFCSAGRFGEITNIIFITAGGSTQSTVLGNWSIGTTQVSNGIKFAQVKLDVDNSTSDEEIGVNILTNGNIVLGSGQIPATLRTSTECV